MGDIFQNSDIANLIKIVQELQTPSALAKARKNPVKFFAQHGIELPATTEYGIYLNNDEYYYFVLPPSMDFTLSDEQMNEFLAAGGPGGNRLPFKASTASTITTLATASTASCPASLSSFSCLTTASTVASAVSKCFA